MIKAKRASTAIMASAMNSVPKDTSNRFGFGNGNGQGLQGKINHGLDTIPEVQGASANANSNAHTGQPKINPQVWQQPNGQNYGNTGIASGFGGQPMAMPRNGAPVGGVAVLPR